METNNNTNYFISNFARVKSIKNGKERLLKPFKSNNKNSYFQIALSIKGKVYKEYIHRLIAKSFISNIDNAKEVNHKNGNKLDNQLANLEWVSHRDNMKHAKATGLSPKRTNTKLSEIDIPVIKEKYNTGKYFQKDLAKMFGVSIGTINGIILNNHWTEYGKK